MVYSIFLRPTEGGFNTGRLRAWLEARPDTLADPVGGGEYMVCGSPASVEYARQERIDDPSRFPYCVLISIAPEEIVVVQEFGNRLTLPVARDFVKTVVDETICEIGDEGGGRWTEQVRREGVGVLYPPGLA